MHVYVHIHYSIVLYSVVYNCPRDLRIVLIFPNPSFLVTYITNW